MSHKSSIKNYLLFLLIIINGRIFGQDQNIEDTLQAVRNAIKLDPVPMLLGDYHINYERIITPHLSSELLLGFTRRNYFAGAFDYDMDNLGDNIEIRTGYSFGLDIRYYFEKSEELNGPYASLGYAQRKYSKIYHVVDSTAQITGDTFEDQRKYSEWRLLLGYQLLPRHSNLFFDFYLGTGLRKKDFTMVKAENILLAESYYLEDLEEVKAGFYAGIKIGFGF